MTFATALALAVALLVAAPTLAHLLRRRQAEERPFAAAHLVPPTLPQARRRSLLEDRALWAVRALAVVFLALLGATPLVRCSQLSLERKAGASVALAIVLDDSLSMRAAVPGANKSKTPARRFDEASRSARELVGGLRPGDAVAIVLAGAPARVALATTTNLGAVGAALDALVPSDRATDLDGALALARGLLKGMPQTDRRIVVLSDLADGAAEAAPLGAEAADIATWVPRADLAGAADDCAVVRADRTGTRIVARVVCVGAAPWAERSITARAGDKALATAKLGAFERAADIALQLPNDAPENVAVSLDGADAVADDDSAPAVTAGGSLVVADVVDATATHVETGGPPPFEQALAALELDVQLRPLPSVPEQPDELKAFAALVVDDVPGFTPEVRRSLAAWIEHGGVVLLTLGPRAAAAPLGASFDPLVPGVVRWGPTPARGVDVEQATLLGAAAPGFADLAPRGRASLDEVARQGADVVLRWSDGAPLLIRRALGRGVVLALTLPLSTDHSDLVLRPGFLGLVDRVVTTARARGGARRIDVGEAWLFDGFEHVTVRRMTSGTGAPSPVASESKDGRLRAVAPLAGLYEITLEGETSVRAAAVPEREIDFRPRRVHDAALAASHGGIRPTVDVSPIVALVLLGLLFVELLLRALGARAPRPVASAGAIPRA